MMRASLIVCVFGWGVASSALGLAQPAHVTPASTIRARGDTTGPAAGVGVGYQTPILGGQILYYVRLGERRISVAPYVGVAFWPVEGPDDKVGFAVGAMAVYGRRNRLVADLSYGLAAVERGVYVITPEPYSNALYGVTLGLGYEVMSPEGVFLRVTGGATFRTDDTMFAVDHNRIGPTFHLGAGYKFR